MADNKPDKAQEEVQKKEQEESKKEVVSVCTLNLRQILVALHEKALSEVKGEITILNSAIEGSGGKDAKFYGAGEHIIAAIPKDNKGIANNKIEKKDAVLPLQDYIQWFVGPDLKGKVTENILKPLEDGAEGKVADNHEKKDNIEKSKNDSVAGEKYEKDEAKKESTIFVPSFSQYLLTEKGEASTTKDQAKDNKEKVKDKNAEDAKDVQGAPSKGPNQAQGWYVEYRLKIPGQKEHSITDAMKKLGADIIKAIGVKFTSLFGGADGKVHTVGDLVDGLDAIFGKMDVSKFEPAVNEELKKRMKGTEAQAKVWDTKTILKFLKKETAKSKSKIAPAKYALCIKVNKNDPSYKLFNEDAVANVINAAISASEVMRGLGKRLKGMGVKGKDVILVNNYEDNKKNDKSSKDIVDKAQGSVVDSLHTNNILPLIVEDGEEAADAEEKVESKEPLAPDKLQSELESLAKSSLGEEIKTDHPYKYSEVLISKTEDIIEKLKSEGEIDEQNLFDELSKSEYSFLIKTTELKKSSDSSDNKNTQKESINVKNSLMKILFERVVGKDTEVVDIVRNIFLKLLATHKDQIDGDTKKDAIEKLQGHVSDKTNESIIKTSNFMHMIYENFDDFILFEKSNSLKDLDHITNDLAKLLNSLIHQKTLKNILNNKDAINKKWGEPKQGLKDFKWPGKYKEYIDEFSKLVYDQDDELKVIDYVNKAVHNKGKDAKLQKVVLTRFIPAIKLIEDKKETEKVKVNFYDVDPKSGEKLKDPLNKEPFEVEKGSKIKDNEDINSAIVEFNELLREEKPGEGDKEGYRKRGWEPAINDTIAEDDPTEILAKYIEEDKKDKEFTVQLLYAPDQEKPNATEIIKIDDKEDQQVKFGEAAKLPEEMPEIDGYKFKDWGDDTEKLKKVEEDIVAVALYEKTEDEKQDNNTRDVYYIIPDENRLLEKKLGSFTVRIVNPDPEDPDNTGSQQDIAKITVIDGKYEVAELKTTAKETKNADDKKKLEDAAAENEKAFKAVENINEITKKAPNNEKGTYKFLGWTGPETKDGETQDLKEIISNGVKDGEDELVVKAKYGNDMKAKHTNLDFYIVPMKGLKDPDKHKDNTSK